MTFYFRQVAVIVKSATYPGKRKKVEKIQTNDLKPYQNNTQDPYITAYFKADVLPLTFVIGDSKKYEFERKTYFNQPLKQNSSYIVFLRFFENKVNSINKTVAKPARFLVMQLQIFNDYHYSFL